MNNGDILSIAIDSAILDSTKLEYEFANQEQILVS